jgi:flagellar hook-associated protein 2
MATISSIGSGSGLPLEDIITKVVEAEKVPTETRLNLRTTTVEANISAYGSLKSTMSSFKTSLGELSDPNSASTRRATSSDEKIFEVTADNDTPLGTNQVQVLNLASTHKIASPSFDTPFQSIGEGTVTVKVGNRSTVIEVGESDNNSPSKLRDAINNATDNPGVTASLVTIDNGQGDGGTVTKLVLTAKESGKENEISITVEDSDGNNSDDSGLSRLHFDASDIAGSQMGQLNEAKDARIAVDGLVATSSTNKFNEVLEGITITAIGEPEDPNDPPTATLTIEQSDLAAKGNVEKFVAGFNELFTTIKELTKVDQASGQGGLLTGDSAVRQMASILRRELTRPMDGAAPGYESLASIGILTERDGTLSVDSKKLNDAIANDIDAVMAMFSGDKGLASRMEKEVSRFLGPDGIIKAKEDGFDTEKRAIADEQEALSDRLNRIETRYRAQFTALDTLVNQLNGTQAFLTQQLEAIANLNKK